MKKKNDGGSWLVGDVLGTVIPDLDAKRAIHAMRTHMNFVLLRGSNGMLAPGPRRRLPRCEIRKFSSFPPFRSPLSRHLPIPIPDSA